MDLLEEYIKSGRIKLNTHKYHEAFTVHDPCNYVRKSVMLYGDNPNNGEKTRWIAQQCIDPSLYREMIDDPLNNLCCGAGGGAWAMPYDEERLAYGKMKADQIKATGAEIVIAPCHNCRDQIMKGLGGEHKEGHAWTWATTRRPCTSGNWWPTAWITSPGARKRSRRPTPPGTPSSSGTASSWKKRNKA